MGTVCNYVFQLLDYNYTSTNTFQERSIVGINIFNPIALRVKIW